jgi:hypothetical protein
MMQEGVLVAVQVVHQVAIAAVLSDDVDGSCGGTGSGTVPGRLQASHQGNEQARCGEVVGKMGKRVSALQTWVLFLPMWLQARFLVSTSLHGVSGAKNDHHKDS